MAELLPTRQAESIKDGLLDYLTTTFALADDDARQALAEFLGDPDQGLFKGPFLRLRLPFRPATGAAASGFAWIPGFVPYGHQAAAFARLASTSPTGEERRPLPTLITTGTGSGKTEAFLYPILDHVLRARRAGVTGMKALILYPMNALANDQAKRLTELLTTREELAGVTAALYTGQEGKPRTKVTAEGLITDRGIIRDSAPDVLLTNYKMLDQLLLRHEDQRLWQQSASSLQYLVLDEFHTYDGAQGTDVAMLLRRLGLALKSHVPEGGLTDMEQARPLGRVTPVATSATLGDQGDPAAMLEFARTVFGEDLPPESVVGEERLSLTEWVGDAEASLAASGLVPKELVRADLAPLNEMLGEGDLADAHVQTLRVLAALYDVPAPRLITTLGDDPSALLRLVKAHPQIQRLAAASEQATGLADLAEHLFPGPGPTDSGDEDRVTFLTHLVAALSHVRATAGRAALTVDLHLWVRELTRIDRVASSTAEYRWSDDGAATRVGEDPFAGQAWALFPAIYCRHCGRWKPRQCGEPRAVSTPLENWTVSPVKSGHPEHRKGDHVGGLGIDQETRWRGGAACADRCNKALYLFGREAEVMFASHSWPRWGNDRVQEVMRTQRDTYAHLNNGVLHLANQGVTINEIHNRYRVPASLQQQWPARSYHGSVEHNCRGVVNRYLGYWDGNPTTLIPLSPDDSAPLYVELMGGAAPILAKGRDLVEAGQYLLATEILDKLVHAEPGNADARQLLADAFEQVGYQQESPSVRNSFLAAALELRSGIPTGGIPNTGAPDVIRALSTSQFLDVLGIRLDSAAAEGQAFTINLVTPDNGEKYVVELSNGSLTNLEGFLADDADLTLTVNRADLEEAMVGTVPLTALIGDGRAAVTGDLSVLQRLASMLVHFEVGFEIMPGTGEGHLSPPMEDFQVEPLGDSSGG